MKLLHCRELPVDKRPARNELVHEALLEDDGGDFWWFRCCSRVVDGSPHEVAYRVEFAVLTRSGAATEHAATAARIAAETMGGDSGHSCDVWWCPLDEFTLAGAWHSGGGRTYEPWSELLIAALGTAEGYGAIAEAFVL